MLELISALLLGLLMGTITGLFPSLHVNLLSTVLLSSSTFILNLISPLFLVVLLISIATAHIFINFIPSIFLGAPSEDSTAISVLPGHEFLQKGEGYSAIIYTLYGGIIGLILLLIFSPIFYYLLPLVYPYANRIMHLLLLTAIFFLIYFEKHNKLLAIIIFLLSGILGIISLNFPIKDSLLPMFTGLFGISSLISSISPNRNLIPEQNIKSLKEISIEKDSIKKTLSASCIASPLCSFLPGMGSGQAAVLGSEITENLSQKEFLMTLGSINIIVTGLSFITLYSIGKARTGIAAAVGELIELNPKIIFIITLTIILAGILSFFISILIARLFSKIIPKLNYSLTSIIIIILLMGLTFYFSKFYGLALLLTSTILGLLCIYSGVRRTHLMGCLIIPALIFYLI